MYYSNLYAIYQESFTLKEAGGNFTIWPNLLDIIYMRWEIALVH